MRSFKATYRLYINASLEGWGAHLDDQVTSWLWSAEERTLHLNRLEFKAAFNVVHHWSQKLLVFNVVHHWSQKLLVFNVVHHWSQKLLVFNVVHHWSQKLLVFNVVHHWSQKLFEASLMVATDKSQWRWPTSIVGFVCGRGWVGGGVGGGWGGGHSFSVSALRSSGHHSTSGQGESHSLGVTPISDILSG